MRTLVAVDLAEAGEGGPDWRRLRVAVAPADGGLVTAGGYRFAETEAPAEADALRVEITTQDRARRGARAEGRVVPAVSVQPRESTEKVGLDVESGRARVGIADAAWSDSAGPVLLAVSLAWRFGQIDRRLDDLSAWTRGAVGRPGGRVRRGELGERLRALRTLVLDLPCFEGPLVDPRGYFATPAEVALFRALAGRLGLGRWRQRIDERVEVVEALLEALAEERHHFEALACEVALEVSILLMLLVDVAATFYFAIAG